MSLFRPIPGVIGSGLNPALMAILDPIKQNVEVLTGQRGDLGAGSAALLRGLVRVNPVTGLSTSAGPTGAAFSIEGVPLASGDDYGKAVAELRLLRNDMQAIVETLNLLITQLRG